MTRQLTRRIVLLTAALGTVILAACSNPTAPKSGDLSGTYGGSSTKKACSGTYGGSSTC